MSPGASTSHVSCHIFPTALPLDPSAAKDNLPLGTGEGHRLSLEPRQRALEREGEQSWIATEQAMDGEKQQVSKGNKAGAPYLAWFSLPFLSNVQSLFLRCSWDHELFYLSLLATQIKHWRT